MKKITLSIFFILFSIFAFSQEGRPFITTWKTDNPGTSEDNQITIPTFTGEAYDYYVNWGDGTTSENVTSDITHSYETAGSYTVSISGDFPSIYFANNGDKEKLVSIQQWGDIAWKSMNLAFYGCSNLDVLAIDTPNLSSVTILDRMFGSCTSLIGNSSFERWDVSNIIRMRSLFLGCSNMNLDIGSWNVSNVEDMFAMFFRASNFDQDIGSWDVSKVGNMQIMFASATNFNQNINSWDVSRVSNMDGMFRGAESFNQNIGTWDVKNVVEMGSMFNGAQSFNQNLGDWDIRNVRITSISNGLERTFTNSGLSNENYDKLLLGWSQLSFLQDGLTLDAPQNQYCKASNARQSIIDTYGWVINDEGENCPLELLSITSLTLVNADTNEDILLLTDGIEINVNNLPTLNLNIRANTTNDVASVVFSLTGTINNENIDSVAPFTQFGDSDGIYLSQEFTLGKYFISVSPYSAGEGTGDLGIPFYADFSLINGSELCMGFVARIDNLKNPSDCNSSDGSLSLDMSDFAEPLTYKWSHRPTLNQNFGFNLAQGAYTISFIDANGCNGTIEAMLMAPEPDSELPIANCTNITLQLNENGEATLSPDQLDGGSTDNCNISSITISKTVFTITDLGVNKVTLTVVDDAGNLSSCDATVTVEEFQGQFITTWKTDNPGVSEDNQITIPTKDNNPFGPALVYNYNIDWGDGTTSENVTGDITHTYGVPGTYTVSITGQFPKMDFDFDTEQPEKDRQKLLSVDQWGDIVWEDLRSSFLNCSNMDVVATDTPDLSQITDLNAMFFGCSSLVGNASFGDWDITTISGTSLMFFQCSQFNQDISGWNMANVLDMGSMFNGASTFNQDIGNWNTNNLRDMVLMFSGASSFNQDISGWNVSNVSNFGSTFANATSFDQDLSVWDISNATEMLGLFANSGLSDTNYDNILAGWSQLPSLKNGIVLGAPQNAYCESVDERQFIIDTYGWTINDLGQAFNCGPNQQRPFITVWKTDNVGISEDNQITIPTFLGESYNYSVDWGDGNFSQNITSDITHTYQNPGTYTISILGQFPRIYFNDQGDKEKLLTIQQWGDLDWTSMENAFHGCSEMNVVAQDTPRLEQVTTFKSMFRNCSSLVGNFVVSNWDTSRIVDMSNMFFNASSFNQFLGSWDVSNVTQMVEMFTNASAFNNDLSAWNITKVEDMFSMLDGTSMSVDFYDRLLVAWNNLESLQQNVRFGAGGLQYCQGTAARQNLIDTYNWAILDDLRFTDCPTQERAFITTWKTDNPGISGDNQITIPTADFFTYDFTIDWGDDTISENVTETITHTYAEPGVYTISIIGFYPGPSLQNGGAAVITTDAQKLLTIEQWGDIQWSWMIGAFDGCKNMDMVATDIPDFSNVRFTTAMFQGCSSLIGNSSVSNWDMSTVESTFTMFARAELFNQDISGWDVSKVTSMTAMFQGASSFNQDLSDWVVSEVTDMGGMFDDSSFSNQNYDKILISWSKLPLLQTGLGLGAPDNQYCEAGEERQTLIDTFNWTINDAGETADCQTNQRPFITTWKTDNPGVSEDNQITIPTFSGETYNYTVDWGDGTTTENVTGDITHTYATLGTYTVSITGEFPAIFFNDAQPFSDLNTTDSDKILVVTQWGDIRWKFLTSAFAGCRNMDITALDVPNLSDATSLQQTFFGCLSLFGNESFQNWDVSSITNMASLFTLAENFNQDIGEWDVSNVISMTQMFASAESFNQDISNWDVSQVSDMSQMFAGAISFNQNIGSWNVSNVTNMSTMFSQAETFNSEIGDWDVSNVQFMSGMFSDATSFNQEISRWNVSSVKSMSGMFQDATSFNQNLGSWDVGNVGQPSAFSSMEQMFQNSGLSNENYDRTLIGWSQLPSLQNGVQLDAPQNQYCLSEEARQNIIDTYGWSINDAGLNCPEPTLIITEIMYNPANSDNAWEYIELYNNTATDIDLSGYVIDDNSGAAYTESNIPEGIIPAGESVIVFDGSVRTAEQFEQGWGTSNPIAATRWSILNNTGGDTIGIWDSFESYQGDNETQANVIEQVAYENNTNGWPDDDGFASIYLTDLDADNTIGSNWALSVVGQQTPVFEAYTFSPFGNNQGLDVGSPGIPDAIFPTAICQDVTLTLDENGQATLTTEQVDNGSNDVLGISNLSLSRTNFDCNDIGNSIEVTLTVTNTNGNSDTCTSNINVIDETAPNLTCGTNIVDTTLSGQPLNLEIVPPAVMDNCDTDFSLSGVATLPNNTTFNLDNETARYDFPAGTTNILWSVVDDAGNLGTCTQTVTVNFNPSMGSSITSFNVSGVSAQIDGTAIIAEVPFGTDLTSLTPNIAISEFASVDPTDQEPVDFSNGPVTYTVTAQDNSQTVYSVTIIIAEDTQAPILTSFSPSNGAIEVGLSDNIVLNFDEAVVVNSGSFQFNPVGVGFGGIGFNPSERVVSNENGIVVLDPPFDLNPNQSYYVTIANGIFTDASGNSFSGISDEITWVFTTVTDSDSEPPVLVSLSPMDNQQGVAVDSELKLVFNENVKLGSSNGTISEVESGQLIDLIFPNQDFFADENTITITLPLILEPDTEYRIGLGPNSIEDLAGNDFRGFFDESWTFTTAPEQRPFITTWKTDNPGVSEDNQITIPTFPGETYNYSVDWGDGTTSENVMGDITHTYSTPDTYTVSISGDFPRIYFNNGFVDNPNDKLKILSIKQWGDIFWTSMEDAFNGCNFLNAEAIDTPNLTSVSSLERMFNSCNGLIANESFNNWDVSKVINMADMFRHAYVFNQNIGDWEVSNVTDMSDMFNDARVFNQDIGGWDVSNVELMNHMFQFAFEFNKNISNWDVSKVTNMGSMFAQAHNFNQDIGDWNVSNVTNMEIMFSNAREFNQNISNWDVSNVTSMRAMFNGTNLFDQNIGNWDVSKVESMDAMFQGAKRFNQDISSWNVSNVLEMDYMFSGAELFNQDIGNWNVSSLTNMINMFREATAFNQNIGGWDVGNVIYMNELFTGSGLSDTNYDGTLIGWSQLPSLQNGVQLGAPQNQYCLAEESRQSIIETYGWTINDDGKANDCTVGAEAIWLEAECAVVGSRWNLVSDGSASNAKYVVVSSGNDGPSSNPDNHVSFSFMAEAGVYNVYGLVRATSGTDDSFWVRANGGEWIKWNSIPRSSDFSWQRVFDSDDGNSLVTFNLLQGNNVLDFANREDGTPLDKVYVAPSGSDAPTGQGGASINCDGSNRAPTAVVSSDITSGQAPLTVTFDGSGSTDDVGITSYTWDFGDGATGNGINVSHTYISTGLYTATLTVSDGELSSTDDVLITVTSDQGGNGEALWLEAECAVVGNAWDVVSDGSASNGDYVVVNSGNNTAGPSSDPDTYVSFNFVADAGTYDVYGLVRATNGGDDSFWVRANGGEWIKWNSIPRSSDFSWQRVFDSDDGNSLVTFNLLQGNNVLDFANREDGTPLDKVYVAPSGSDAPTGQGGASINCDGSNRAPTAVVSSDITSGQAPLTVTFDGSGSTDDVGITSYTWDFGDGATGNGINVSHTYISTGLYTATLTVSDGELSSTDDVLITVTSDQGGNGEALWLEAECAVVGNAWDVVSDGSASNGDYVVVNSGNNTAGPSSDPDTYVSFNFVADAGTYDVYGLVRATNGGDDSFWVRANGGEWIKWNSIPRSSDFSWQRVFDSDDGNSLVTFNLLQGNNVLDFANREDGTPLDKVYVAPSGSDAPTGQGGTSINCGTTNQSNSAVGGVANVMYLYPNPASTVVNLSFDEPTEVVEFQVFDLSGRLIRAIKAEQNGQKYELPVFDLPTGTYFIQTMDTNGQIYDKQMLIER